MLDAGSIGANEWPGPISTAQEAMAWSLYNSVTGMVARPPWCLLGGQMLRFLPTAGSPVMQWWQSKLLMMLTEDCSVCLAMPTHHVSQRRVHHDSNEADMDKTMLVRQGLSR